MNPDTQNLRDEALIATVEDIVKAAGADRQGWHLDKKVPISIILALLFQAATGLWFLANMSTDIELLKRSENQQHDRDERQDRAQAEAYLRLSEQLQKVADKLDRIIERGR